MNKAITEDLGVAILAAGTGLALTSALNPSPGTLRELVLRKGDWESAQNYAVGAKITIILGAISSVAVTMVFPGRTGLVAALFMAATTVGLGAYYYSILMGKDKEMGEIGRFFLRRWF